MRQRLGDGLVVQGDVAAVQVHVWLLFFWLQPRHGDGLAGLLRVPAPAVVGAHVAWRRPLWKLLCLLMPSGGGGSGGVSLEETNSLGHSPLYRDRRCGGSGPSRPRPWGWRSGWRGCPRLITGWSGAWRVDVRLQSAGNRGTIGGVLGLLLGRLMGLQEERVDETQRGCAGLAALRVAVGRGSGERSRRGRFSVGRCRVKAPFLLYGSSAPPRTEPLALIRGTRRGGRRR